MEILLPGREVEHRAVRVSYGLPRRERASTLTLLPRATAVAAAETESTGALALLSFERSSTRRA
jgi:hypothetical protein